MKATVQRFLYFSSFFFGLWTFPAGRFSSERASQLTFFFGNTFGFPLPFLSAGELRSPPAVASTVGISTRLASERARERPAVYLSPLVCSSSPLVVRNFPNLNFWDPESPENCSRNEKNIRPPKTMGGNSERLLCFYLQYSPTRRMRLCFNRQYTTCRSEPRTVFDATTQARGEPSAGFVR